MNLYQETSEKISKESEGKKQQLSNANDRMNKKYIEVVDFLNSLGVTHRLEWDGWFKRIEIDISNEIDSRCFKSAIKVKPDGVLEYWCSHYSVNKWSCNEILSEKTDVFNLKTIKTLIVKDIENSSAQIELAKKQLSK